MRLAIREYRLFLDAERTPLQLALIIGAFVVFLGLLLAAFVVERVQFIEVLWLAISTYGLTFDYLNLKTSTQDMRNVGRTNAFNAVYFEEKTQAAKKRVIALGVMFIIGLFAVIAPPNPPNPDAQVSSVVLQVLFFLMGYCIASNAQDSWLYRRRQEVIRSG